MLCCVTRVTPPGGAVRDDGDAADGAPAGVPRHHARRERREQDELHRQPSGEAPSELLCCGFSSSLARRSHVTPEGSKCPH